MGCPRSLFCLSPKYKNTKSRGPRPVEASPQRARSQPMSSVAPLPPTVEAGSHQRGNIRTLSEVSYICLPNCVSQDEARKRLFKNNFHYEEPSYASTANIEGAYGRAAARETRESSAMSAPMPGAYPCQRQRQTRMRQTMRNRGTV